MSHRSTDPRPVPGSTQEPLISEFAADPEMREIIAIFVAEVPERVLSLRATWQTGNRRQLRTLAHQLKGAAGGYGFPQVGHAAATLERMLSEPGDGEPAPTDGRISADLARCREPFEALIRMLGRVSHSG